ncbi:hypothetical protein GCM10023185_29870 [Hymenobacter saemangeumensis]|uniref:Uncharacterized protein n=1 Tax=Hymenobacter saemangeumensis TaxID=1084522 RepID=A0ABP8ILT0_9BACT
MHRPENFTHAPHLYQVAPHHRPASAPLRELLVPAAPAPQLNVHPLLTVYRDGLCNLNGDAARALARAKAVTLAAPTAPGSRWLLLPLAEEQPGSLALYSPDRGGQRFRAYALAAAVFALLPDTQKKLCLEMAPLPGGIFQLTVA